jgi:hypothetical protein
LLDQTRTRVAWELRSESLHESFLNFHCLIKQEQELHESWDARVYMRVFSTFIAWQGRRELGGGPWQIFFSDFTSIFHTKFRYFAQKNKYLALCAEIFHPKKWLGPNKKFLRAPEPGGPWQFPPPLPPPSRRPCCLIKREQELHGSWEARVYMRVSSTFIAWSSEKKSCMRVEKREFTWELSQLSLLDQTRTRVAWELRSESLHESFLNIHCLIKREQELHESWEARVYMRVSSTFIAWSNENKSCMRVDKGEFTWEFPQHSLLDQTRTRVAWELRSESLHESFLNFHCLITQNKTHAKFLM